MFNLRRPPFDRIETRRAVARALDLRRVARATDGQEASPASRGYLHPASGWATDTPLHRFEPHRARPALAALGGRELRLVAPAGDPLRAEAGRQVVLALERAGAKATLQELPPDRLAAAVGEDRGNATFEAAIWSSPALASYDPDYLRLVFGSSPVRAPLNYSGYRSARFDRLSEQVALETNPDRRRRAVRLELRQLARDLPVVPLLFPQGRFAYRPQVYDGWVYVKGTGILDKQSFLPSVAPGRPGNEEGAASSSGPEGGLGAPGLVAVGLLTVALVLAGLGIASSRSRAR
jgi:peptide/nickel transport system substrate-binding protein